MNVANKPIILVIDDNRWELFMEKNKIDTMAGECIVRSFANPLDAQAYAQQAEVDVAFIDVVMPQMNGFALAKQLQGLHPHINIIFMADTDEYMMDFYGTYASGYLLKPISSRKLEIALRNLRFPIVWKKKAKGGIASVFRKIASHCI